MFRCTIAMMTALELSALGSLAAAEPTIDSLIAAIPLLDSSDERLTGFQFRVETHAVADTVIELNFAYAKPDWYRALLTIGEDRFPVFFMAERNFAMIDLATKEAGIDTDRWPSIVLSSDNENIKWEFKFGSKEKARVSVNLASLLMNTDKSGTLTRLPSGRRRIEIGSSSGKSIVSAEFAADEPHAIESVEVRDTETKKLLLAFRDISYNGEHSLAKRPFPAVAELPIKPIVYETPNSAAEIWTRLIRSVLIYGGAINPEMRKHPLLGAIDWPEVDRNRRELGPKLLQAFGEEK